MAEERQITAKTPLPPDDLLFTEIEGYDEISGCFRYEVGLASKDINIAAEKLLGLPITIKVGAGDGVRFFHGLVAEFSLKEFREDYAYYVAVLRPWLWFATNHTDNRIFQNKSVVEIIEAVLSEQKGAKFEKRLQKSYKPRDYVVQYGESDLNFVQRLMEHEGIFYHFDHADGAHTLILTDANAKLKPAAGFETVHYQPGEGISFDRTDYITEWRVTTSTLPGTYTQTDYDFEKPATDLMAKSEGALGHAMDEGENYFYPGNFIERATGEALATVRLEELQAPQIIAVARGTVRGLWSGVTFKFDKFPREAENAEYLVLGVEYHLWDDHYRSSSQTRAREGVGIRLILSPTATPYRPRRRTPKPIMKGPQTAVVVGPAGEEIYTDKYSRVKVQFHWDRLGKKDENTTCFIRVSSVWAGAGWGFIQIPRIGQEVIVDFLEGDPDQPIITGRVYNAAQMPPYGLPGKATQSGWKSNSSPGGGGWNELRFEDKAGAEEVYFQAQKDHNELVKNNESRKIGNDFAENVGHDAKQDIGNDRTETVGHDKSVSVTNNRTVSIGVDDTESVGANRSLSVGSNETISVGANSDETIGANNTQTVGSNQTITIGASQTNAIALNQATAVGVAQETVVGAARSVTVGAGQTHMIGGDDGVTVGGGQSVTIGKDQSNTVAGGQTESIGKDAAQSIAGGQSVSVGKDYALGVTGEGAVKIGKKFVLDVTDEITITCGDASISMKKDGTIQIKGKDITLDGSGKINVKAGGDIIIKGSKVNQN